MALTLNLPAESQQLLQDLAAARGQTPEEFAGALIHDSLQELEDLEQDKIDLLEAREMIRTSRPEDRVAWSILKAEIAP